jgi:hypothetical protein
MKKELLTIRKDLGSPPFLVGFVLLMCLVFCVVYIFSNVYLQHKKACITQI